MKKMNLTSSYLKNFKCIGKGAESRVYQYDDQFLLKIFLPSVEIKSKEEKVKLLMELPLPSNVVKPEELVYVDGEFAGYKMKFISDADSLHEVQKPLFRKRNNLSERDLLFICLRLGQTIKDLHSLGIVLGDIRSYNFLLKKNEVYLIDIDSWGFADKSNLLPDAYTIDTIPSYCFDKEGKVTFSPVADLYGFAIVAFNILASIHPFDGYYPDNPKMNVTDRMKQGISVLGDHNIRIPASIPLWNWLSIDLRKAFIDVFEKNDKTVDIIKAIKKECDSFVYCEKHKVYYNGNEGCRYCLAENSGIYSTQETLKCESSIFLSVGLEGDSPLVAYYQDSIAVVLPNAYIDNNNILNIVSRSNGSLKYKCYELKRFFNDKEKWCIKC